MPQLIFLVLLFGYMDFLIIYKWTVDWGVGSTYAPSIITTMINIPLKAGSTVFLLVYADRLLRRATHVGLNRRHEPRWHSTFLLCHFCSLHSFDADTQTSLLDLLPEKTR